VKLQQASSFALQIAAEHRLNVQAVASIAIIETVTAFPKTAIQGTGLA